MTNDNIDYTRIYDAIVSEHKEEPDAHKQAADALDLIIELEDKLEAEKS